MAVIFRSFRQEFFKECGRNYLIFGAVDLGITHTHRRKLPFQRDDGALG